MINRAPLIKTPHPGRVRRRYAQAYRDAVFPALQTWSKDTHLVVSGMVAQMTYNVKIETVIIYIIIENGFHYGRFSAFLFYMFGSLYWRI